MIHENILRQMGNVVCAVGFLREPLADYAKHDEIAGLFEVVGTGFIVRDEVVITNRHVINDLEEESRRASVPENQRFLLFIIHQHVKQHGGSLNRIARTPRQVRRTYTLRDRRLDVGFIGFNIVRPDHFWQVTPPLFAEPVSRWGPVLQQGWVSAVSPFTGVGNPDDGQPDEFLLDLRAAPGISGSPVFRPESGEVCGLLHSGVLESDRADAVTTTAFAQPISAALLGKWLAEFDQSGEDDD
jgi:hypothetical protein